MPNRERTVFLLCLILIAVGQMVDIGATRLLSETHPDIFVEQNPVARPFMESSFWSVVVPFKLGMMLLLVGTCDYALMRRHSRVLVWTGLGFVAMIYSLLSIAHALFWAYVPS